jgi:hypothetical protein
MGGLELAYKIPRRDKQMSRTVVVVTDGYVGVEAQAFRFIRERLNDANLFAFGIGSSVNRGLIEGMARAGQGEPFVVLRPEKAAAEADKLRDMIEQPVLAHVNVRFSGFDAYEVSPQKLPDLMARRPLVLFGKYRNTPGGRIEVSGTAGGGPLRQVIEVKASDVRAENAALRWLWARRWVETLDDERAMGAGTAAEEGITALGLDYRLLTAFTSFVAIDSQVVNAGGQGENVRQPLPMPEGVSNNAVGSAEKKDKSSASYGFMGGPAQPQGTPGHGTGVGGGGFGRVASAAPTPMAKSAAAPAPAEPAALAPPPPPARTRPPSGRRAAESRDEAESRAPASDRADDATAARLLVTVVGSSGVGQTAALAQAVRAALAKAPGACALGAARTGSGLKLRITIDARGAIVSVDLLAGDKAAERCLRGALVGLTSATAPTRGAATGTVEILLRSR